jgi:hypothetical protein
MAWIQRGMDIDGSVAGIQSGWSVSSSADGTIIAVGEPVYQHLSGASTGRVRVYVWNGSVWTQRGADIIGEAAGDTAGYSVNLSADGSVVAIGAPNNDGTGTDSGHVRV